MSHIISLTNHSKRAFISLVICTLLITTSYAEEHDHEEETTSSEYYSKSQRWGFGIAASVGVSMLGFVMSGLLLLILKWKSLTRNYLKLIVTVLIAFAVGALFGDAVVHIVPEVFGAHSHEEEEVDVDSESIEEEHNHEEEVEPIAAITSLLILIGFGAFVFIEKLFDWIGIAHSHGFQEGDHHGHVHEHGDIKEKAKKEDEELKALPLEEGRPQTELKDVESQQKQGETGKVEEDAVIHARTQTGDFDLNENKSSSCLKTLFSMKGRKTSGIMILMADFLHNIMDGLAIGVAFASGKKDLAISTFVAVLAHEIPQEIGDMGILLESKFPVLQALVCNGLINFSAIIGTLIGLGIGSINEAANAYVLAFVAGNFLYIALVSMLPMVMKEIRGKTSILILFAFVLGAGIQFALLAAED